MGVPVRSNVGLKRLNPPCTDMACYICGVKKCKHLTINCLSRIGIVDRAFHDRPRNRKYTTHSDILE